MDLLKSGFYSVLPWITMAISANAAGLLADTLIQKGVSITRVRKAMQTVQPCFAEPEHQEASCIFRMMSLYWPACLRVIMHRSLAGLLFAGISYCIKQLC